MPNPTVPAAATGLPNLRRRFLTQLAALPIVGVIAGPVLAGGAEDAELLALCKEWEASAARYAHLNELAELAEDAYVRPPYPRALVRRPGDFAYFSGFLGDDLDLVKLGDHELEAGKWTRRWLYVSDDTIEHVHKMRAEALARPLDRCTAELAERQVARCDEIIAARDAWKAECRRRADACGLTVIEDALERETEINRALRTWIIATKARTLAGCLIKARVSCWSQAPSVDDLQADVDAALKRGDRATSELVAMSLVADLLRLQEART